MWWLSSRCLLPSKWVINMSHRIFRGSSNPLRDKIAHFAIFWQKYPMGLLPINGWFWLVSQSKMVKWVKMFPLAYFRQFTYFLLLCTKTMAYTRWRHRDVIWHSWRHAIFYRATKISPLVKIKSSSSGAFRFKPVPIMVAHVRSGNFRSKFLDPKFPDRTSDRPCFLKSQCSVCHIHFMSDHQ